MQEVVFRSILREIDGFVFLEVHDSIIDAFVKIIPDHHVKKPGVAHHATEYVGAHISVMYPEETKRFQRNIKEVGKPFEYTLGGVFSSRPNNWIDVEEVYFLTVNSLELEALRKSYGLRSRLNGNDFHLTVGVRTNGAR